jgi:hypothetical protein
MTLVNPSGSEWVAKTLMALLIGGAPALGASSTSAWANPQAASVVAGSAMIGFPVERVGQTRQELRSQFSAAATF